MSKIEVGDFVRFLARNPDTNGNQECYGTIVKVSKFKATVETLTKYTGTPMQITMHASAFKAINPEDVV